MPETGPRSIGAVRVLRISLTDRCNYRCVYCMPAGGVAWLPRDDLLSFEEIEQIVRASISEHGIRRFKLTGGEPTVRRGVVDLVRKLRAVDGVEDLSLTTNGELLEDLAQPLYEAGLDRITISIDSLRPERFTRITRTGNLDKVLRGLARSLDAGFQSVKLNCVTMRGVNDDELADFARLTLDRPVTVRFIEYMPLGDSAVSGSLSRVPTGEGWGEGLGSSKKDGPHPNPLPDIPGEGTTSAAVQLGVIADDETGPRGGCGAQDRGDVFISETEVRDRIERELGPLVSVERSLEPGVGPAIPYRVRGAAGRIGFISAMSAPFCSTCNRLRLTATGVLRSCLFEGGEVDLRPILRGDSQDDLPERIAQAMADCVRLKPEVHSRHGNEQMSRIGG